MSVVAVREKFASDSSTADVKGRRTYILIQWVESDNPRDTANTIYAAPGVPRKYQPYATDIGALAKNVVARKIAELAKGGAIWEVTTNYDSEFSDSPSEHPDQDKENPLERPTIFSWGGAIFQESQDEDKDEKAYVNSAGDPFDPAPLVEVVHGIITATRNVAAFDEARAEYFRNKVNSDVWRGHDKDSCKVAAYGGQGPLFENDTEFYTETIEVHTNPWKWIPWDALDRGPRHIELDDQGLPRRVYTTDDDGVPSTVQVLLDGNGQETETASYISFRQYERAPFSALDLG